MQSLENRQPRCPTPTKAVCVLASPVPARVLASPVHVPVRQEGDSSRWYYEKDITG